MTREEALQQLNLPPDADQAAIEKAYQRMVRRYPPEFHPDKFRTIDECYRQLTSLPAMIEKLLSPAVEDVKPDPALLAFTPFVPGDFIEDALEEIRTAALAAVLWKRPDTGETDTGKKNIKGKK